MDTNRFKVFAHPLINGLSDHDAQIVTLYDIVSTNTTKMQLFTRTIESNSINRFIEMLSNENWDEVFQDLEVNFVFNKFHDIYLRLFYCCFPLKKKPHSRIPKNWITNGIKISCAKKRELFRIYRFTNDLGFKRYYKKYCKILASVIVAAKKKFYNEQILNSRNKIKTTWNIIKTTTNNRNNNTNLNFLNTKNGLASDPVQITESFNTYFTSIAGQFIMETKSHKNLVNDNPLSFLYGKFNQFKSRLKFKFTTTHEINKMIMSLNVKDSYGYDEISSRILKISAPFIVSPLTFIINKILSSGVFPDRLKFSEVIPIFKKGSKTELANYRPVSLLPVFSKIIEKIIYKRLYNYLCEHNLLCKEQFGFRSNISTDSAIFDLLNSVLFSLDKKHFVGGLFCDLQKAFDCVNHKILLDKLKFYGVLGLEYRLIQSYLCNRFQRVKLRNKVEGLTTSTWRKVEHGVPQGSVLGPLLFLVYINDLVGVFTNAVNPVLFADDTSIIINDADPDEFIKKLEETVRQCIRWFQCNLLSMNYDKTHILQFSMKNQKQLNTQVVATNSIISNVNAIKFLGLKLDKNLSWEYHILDLKQKLNKACYAIRTTKSFMSQHALKMIYCSYFHSIMSHGIIFWGNSQTNGDIFKIQKRTVRILANKMRHDSCRSLFQELQILTLSAQYIYSLLVFVVKNKNLYTLNSEIHNVHTRTKNDLHLPSVNRTITQRGVLYSGSILFNSLPTRIKCLSGDETTFKKKLRNFLLQHTIYSIEEFYQAVLKDKS
jgi:hypothetical protein